MCNIGKFISVHKFLRISHVLILSTVNHLSSSKVLIFKMRWLFQRDALLSLQLSCQSVQTSLISSGIWTHFKISTHTLWDPIPSSNLLQDHVLGQEMALPSFESDTFQKGIKFKSCTRVQITLEQYRSLGYTRTFIYLFVIWPHGVLVVAGGLFRCSTWTLQLWPAGLVAQRPVGSQFPDQGLNLCPLHCKVNS